MPNMQEACNTYTPEIYLGSWGLVAGYQGEHLKRGIEVGNERVAYGLQFCESPIEEIVLPWLVFACYHPFTVEMPVVCGSRDVPYHKADILIVPQFSFSRFRFDFAVIARRRDLAFTIAVECDGFAFHDLGEDRERDACLAAFRIPTIRASGKELHRAPHLVAEKVNELVTDWHKRTTRHQEV